VLVHAGQNSFLQIGELTDFGRYYVLDMPHSKAVQILEADVTFIRPVWMLPANEFGHGRSHQGAHHQLRNRFLLTADPTFLFSLQAIRSAGSLLFHNSPLTNGTSKRRATAPEEPKSRTDKSK